MLGTPSSSGRPPFAWAEVLLVVFLAALAGAAFCWNRDWVFFGGEVFFADGDCYARMTRVRLMDGNPFVSLRHHVFENFPAGTTPHTTAPLDVLIWSLRVLLSPFVSQPLPLAGAVVSPLLGVATLLFLALWAWRLSLPGRWPALLLFALSPMSAQAFLLGRPDHQSLLVFLLALAWGAETALWLGKRGPWSYVSAAAWALALWVSLFEPLVLLAVVLLLRVARSGLAKAPLRRPACGPALCFVVILLVALVWDGWRAGGFDRHFAAWSRNIGELRAADWGAVFGWVGWLLPAIPILLLLQGWKHRQPAAWLWLGMVGVTAGLTFWHARWGYFLVLAAAMSLPFAMSAVRWRLAACTLFAVSLLPVASSWERVLFPEDVDFRARTEALADAVAVRDAAREVSQRPPGAILAPWWLSPAIVWWSGFPCVTGTSHQALPGTVDAARFFLGEETAWDILRERRVRYIFAYDPSRVISNSAQILDMRPPENPIAAQMFRRSPPAGLQLVYANRLIRVFTPASTNFQQEEELAVSPLWTTDVKRGIPGEPNGGSQE